MKHALSPNNANSLMLVIDIQNKLSPVMAKFEQVKSATLQLANAAANYDIPVLVTQQYAKGLGETDEVLKGTFNNVRYFDKVHFSAFKEPGFKSFIENYNKPQVIVVGMEAHVCVLQTCLDLLAYGYHVFLVADAICSRNSRHCDIAINQLRSAGAIITCAETIIFQWAEVSDTEAFKKILKIVK